jgi:hypothetical protein
MWWKMNRPRSKAGLPKAWWTKQSTPSSSMAAPAFQNGIQLLKRSTRCWKNGSPAIMSRATAGIIKGRVLFSTPGSENAVRLAMEKLILPELGHLVKELTK